MEGRPRGGRGRGRGRPKTFFSRGREGERGGARPKDDRPAALGGASPPALLFRPRRPADATPSNQPTWRGFAAVSGPRRPRRGRVAADGRTQPAGRRAEIERHARTSEWRGMGGGEGGGGGEGHGRTGCASWKTSPPLPERMPHKTRGSASERPSQHSDMQFESEWTCLRTSGSSSSAGLSKSPPSSLRLPTALLTALEIATSLAKALSSHATIAQLSQITCCIRNIYSRFSERVSS